MKVTWTPITCRHREKISGIIISFHDTEPTCDGSVSFCNECRPQGPVWTVVQEEPLTLDPSIRCKTHGEQHHGYIRNGEWVPT